MIENCDPPKPKLNFHLLLCIDLKYTIFALCLLTSMQLFRNQGGFNALKLSSPSGLAINKGYETCEFKITQVIHPWS